MHATPSAEIRDYVRLRAGMDIVFSLPLYEKERGIFVFILDMESSELNAGAILISSSSMCRSLPRGTRALGKHTRKSARNPDQDFIW